MHKRKDNKRCNHMKDNDKRLRDTFCCCAVLCAPLLASLQSLLAFVASLQIHSSIKLLLFLAKCCDFRQVQPYFFIVYFLHFALADFRIAASERRTYRCCRHVVSHAFVCCYICVQLCVCVSTCICGLQEKQQWCSLH